jgi:molybdopterin converting factor small subunit
MIVYWDLFMTITIHIPPLLTTWFGGRSEIEAEGDTVGVCLANLIDQYPGLEMRLKNLVICLNGEVVQTIHYGRKTLKDGDVMSFLPRMSGG